MYIMCAFLRCFFSKAAVQQYTLRHQNTLVCAHNPGHAHLCGALFYFLILFFCGSRTGMEKMCMLTKADGLPVAHDTTTLLNYKSFQCFVNFAQKAWCLCIKPIHGVQTLYCRN